MSTDADLLARAESFLLWADFYSIPLYRWQREAFGQATERLDGRFTHRVAGISVPRGNGKSYGAAAVASWRLQHGPQPQLILSAALDFEGARVVLDHGKHLLASHPDLAMGVELRAEEILIPSTGSRWIVRSREHTASRGLHPDVVIYDEVGWARDDELFASLLAAQAGTKHDDPLALIVSTVGRRRSGPLWNVKALAEATT